MKEIFLVRRLCLLIRSDVVDGYRSLLMVSATLAGVILLSSALRTGTLTLGENFYRGWFAVMLFFWGTIASSRVFRELHDKTRNEAYLLLPASSLEKTVAGLLAVTIGFIAYLLVFTWLLSVVAEGLNSLLFERRGEPFVPFDSVWVMIANYIVIQSFYFLGAAWFRKRHFIKTTLAITVACICLAILAQLIARIFFGSYWWMNIGYAMDAVSMSYGLLTDAILVGMTLLYFVVVPATCWYVAWLRVRETQVSDGV